MIDIQTMTSISHQPIYEDDKTYPVVLNHRIHELSGRVIKNRLGAQQITLTVSQYEDILDRIKHLEYLMAALLKSRV